MLVSPVASRHSAHQLVVTTRAGRLSPIADLQLPLGCWLRRIQARALVTTASLALGSYWTVLAFDIASIRSMVAVAAALTRGSLSFFILFRVGRTDLAASAGSLLATSRPATRTGKSFNALFTSGTKSLASAGLSSVRLA